MGKQGKRNVITVSFFFSRKNSYYPPGFEFLQGYFLVILVEILSYPRGDT